MLTIDATRPGSLLCSICQYFTLWCDAASGISRLWKQKHLGTFEQKPASELVITRRLLVADTAMPSHLESPHTSVVHGQSAVGECKPSALHHITVIQSGESHHAKRFDQDKKSIELDKMDMAHALVKDVFSPLVLSFELAWNKTSFACRAAPDLPWEPGFDTNSFQQLPAPKPSTLSISCVCRDKAAHAS